jgi:uncharacterized protein
MSPSELLISVSMASISQMFSDVSAVFSGSIVTVEDDRFDYGEERFVTFGLLQGHVVAVVHTESEDYIRIISARKATKYEQKTYFEQI